MGKRKICVSKIDDGTWLLVNPVTGEKVGEVDREGLSCLGLSESEVKYLNLYTDDRQDREDFEVKDGEILFRPYKEYGKFNLEFSRRACDVGMKGKDLEFVFFLMSNLNIKGNIVKKSKSKYMDINGIMSGMKISKSKAYELLSRAKEFDVVRIDDKDRIVFNPYIFYRGGRSIDRSAAVLFDKTIWKS